VFLLSDCLLLDVMLFLSLALVPLSSIAFFQVHSNFLADSCTGRPTRPSTEWSKK